MAFRERGPADGPGGRSPDPPFHRRHMTALREAVADPPDRNPIERAFAKGTGEVHQRKPRTVPHTEPVCGDALDWCPPDVCRNEIRHAGDQPQGTDRKCS